MHHDTKYIKKFFKILLICGFLSPAWPGISQVYLTEGFELGGKPVSWTEEYESGTEPWRYRNGGHSPNDNNWLVPPDQIDITRNPPSAYAGTYNAIFFKQGDNNERTKLITPAMNLLGGTKIELSFYLCQVPWTFEGYTSWDVLRVYYKVSEAAPWVLLHEYLDPVYEWQQQTLILPNLSSTYYVAFEGHTRWGYGTCIDAISIEEKGSQPMWIKEMEFEQPFTNNVPSGTLNVPVMRIGLVVYGNTGDALLDHINFTSLNTNDGDIQTNGVKLYSTLNQAFNTSTPVGPATNFVSGIAGFSGLSYSLPRGQSYLWLVYDLNTTIANGNVLDVMLEANNILANDTLYPAVTESPYGSRVIYEAQYSEDFEDTHNWTLTGEFEVGSPSGSGGSPGNPDPSSAFSGTRVLGTDLTGLGSFQYNYEPNLSGASCYQATSPAINLLYYKNLNLFFQRYLNIEVWDNSYIQISDDNGTTWSNLWESTSYVSEFQWTQQQIPISDAFSRTDQFKLRFQLGPTDGINSYSGWNIDDIFVTGEFISRDVGVSQWIYPKTGSGHSANDSVTVHIRNYGGAVITDPVPVAYSFNGGLSWIVDNMTSDIPVGDSVTFTFPTKVDLSVPGLRPSVLAKTIFPGDQYTGNDQVTMQVYIVPTYTPPYLENFETNSGYFRSTGNNFWEYGTPAGSVINSASSGTKSWVTGLTRKYGDIVSQQDRTIFNDDFESDQGWTFSGEFERNIPNNMYLPYFAYTGYYCIGTDLSGQGTILHNYENGISAGTAYTAVSPAFDVSEYSNLTVGYSAWITIRAGDSVKFEVSKDNGTKWYTLWKNTAGEIMQEDFIYYEFSLNDTLTTTSTLRFRFSLFYSSAAGPVAQGWSIDNFLLTGDLVSTEAGYLSTPSYDLTGILDPVLEARLWVETEPDVDGATLLYSLDDGNIWLPVTNSSGFDTYWNWYTGKPVSALGSDGWSGHSGGWITARHLLPAAVAGNDNVQFRLKFMADKFNNQFDGIGVDDIRIMEAPHDLGVLDILSPVTACDIGPNRKFTLRLKNYGINSLQPGDSVRIGYHINRAGELQTGEETIYLSAAFLPGTTQDIVMNKAFDFSASGSYQAEVFTIETEPFFYQNTSNDSLYRIISVNRPVVDLGPDISTAAPGTITLTAFSGTTGYSYLWQDASTDSVYHVTDYGIHYVRVTSGTGCVNSDTVEVKELFYDIGVSRLVSPVSGCNAGGVVPVEMQILNFGTDTLYVNDSIFVFRDINTLILKDTLVLTEKFFPGDTINYTYSGNFDFSAAGAYQMKLYTRFPDDVLNNNDTLKTSVEVYGYPQVDLGPDTTVLASQYTLSVLPGYFSYMWQDGSDMNTFTVDQPGRGLYYVTVNDVHMCSSSDTVDVTLNVYDIKLDSILTPEISCGLSGIILIAARIENTGNMTIPSGHTINMGYQNGAGLQIQQPSLLTEDFLPGDSIDFVFALMAPAVIGLWYDFTVYADYNNDMRSWNDTLAKQLTLNETPVVNLGEDRIVTDVEYILDAGSGFASYLWQDGSKNQTFTVKIPGINNCRVIVTGLNGCTGYDEVKIMLSTSDIGVVEIINPKNSCSLGNNEKVKVAIKNMGNYDIETSASISVSYSINGGTAVTENVVLSTLFESGSVIYHTFSEAENLSVSGQYMIAAATFYGSDLVPSNDTLKTTVSNYGDPVVDIGAGNDTILVYDPIVLSAPTGYASYEWQDGNTSPDYSISNPGTGTYSVLVTDSHGCYTRDSVFVAYDVPDAGITRIVNPVSSCSLSQSTHISFEIINNGFYRISQDSTFTIFYTVNSGNQVSEVVHPASNIEPDSTAVLTFTGGFDFSTPGSYTLDVNLSYSFDANLTNNHISSSISMWGLPAVEIGNGKDTLRTILPADLEADTGYTSYKWQDNSTDNSFKVIKWGLYWVDVTNSYGCTARDSVYVFSPTGINDIRAFPEIVKIYPNPVNDILNIRMEMGTERNITVEMFDLLNIVYREDFKQVKDFNKEIDVHKFAPGIYFIRITIDHIPFTFSVIVE
ncbi:MAG: hypothetical protein A2Z69_00010 [Bacteroidetes bacterium RBG_13_44_24]|nr:MAG: hypothetical protein A2Z69_00010 [Bacteroidetes bacterium RBG_13_44_24]